MSELDANIIVDGQKVVATLAQSGDVIKDGGAIDVTSVIQTDNGPQKVVKVMDVNGGGGGGGTVDQTYDPTSTNAQSGTAVAEAVAPALKNTATGVSSLTILGQANFNNHSMNIGINSQGGYNSIAIGELAVSNNSNCVAIGYSAKTGYSQRSVAIGLAAEVTSDDSIAIGRSTKVSADNAIQLGSNGSALTENNNAKTLQVFEHQLLDGTTGLIPAARLGTGFDASKTQVLKNVQGVLTWVDEA